MLLWTVISSFYKQSFANIGNRKHGCSRHMSGMDFYQILLRGILHCDMVFYKILLQCILHHGFHKPEAWVSQGSVHLRWQELGSEAAKLYCESNHSRGGQCRR